MTKQEKAYEIKRYIVVIFASLLYSFAVSKFLTPNGFLTGGVTGIALLIVKIFDLFSITLDKGILVFILNLPLLLLAYKGLHKSFFILSLLSIGIQSAMFSFLDLEPILNGDMLANGLIGGGLVGFSGGICLKYGGSTGGIDILSQYVSVQKNGAKVGTYSLFVNFGILVALALFFDIEIAIYTAFGFVANSVMVNKIHTSYNLVRVKVVTSHYVNVKEAILKKYIHGVTIYEVEGAFSGQRKMVLESICYRHELSSFTSLVLQEDEKAFITISPVSTYSGNFVRKIIQ